MTNHYNIQITSTNTFLKATFKNGKFKKLEHLRGKLNQQMLNNLCRIIPLKAEDIPNYQNRYKGKVVYELIVKEKTIYTQFVEAWHEFYLDYAKVPPKFTGIDGRAIKQIISYLKSISTSDQEAIALWQLILQNWNNIDAFHRKNTDLKYINSNLNKIWINVKNCTKNTKQTFANAMESETAKGFKFK